MKRTIRRISSFFLVICLAFTLGACGAEPAAETSPQATAEDVAQAGEAATSVAPAAESPTEPAAAPATTEPPDTSPTEAPVGTSAPDQQTPTAAPPAAPTEKLSVLAGHYPLQYAAQRVGGNRVQAQNLVPAGAEPHDLELSPRELGRLQDARLLVYVGAGFQPGLEDAVKAVEAPNLAALDVTKGMKLMEGEEHGHGEEGEHAAEEGHEGEQGHEGEPEGEHAEEEGHEGEHGEAEHALDPHVWLDPALMKEVAGKVRDALSTADPAGRAVYDANARRFQAELDALDGEFKGGLQNCARKELVTSHAAFGYLAKRYGLQQVPITGLSPESEPSPQRLQAVVKLARERDVKAIYFETLVDPRVARTIAEEVGAKTLLLNPIEGLTPEEEAQGKDYMDIMRQNLTALRDGQGCR